MFLQNAILLQTWKILVRNAKLAKISDQFWKIWDSCNLGLIRSYERLVSTQKSYGQKTQLGSVNGLANRS